MFNRKKQQEQADPPAIEKGAAEAWAIKYPQPHVLMIDVKSEVVEAVRVAGYNVSNGSFGKPYEVAKDDDYQPLIVGYDLPPDFSEYEIVIIDTNPPPLLSAPEGEKRTSLGEDDWWIKHSRGQVDPRPVIMEALSAKFDRIVEHGGIFIVLASPQYKQDIVFGHRQSGRSMLAIREEIAATNWSFLSILNPLLLTVQAEDGQIINLAEEDNALLRTLGEHITNGSFTCTLHPRVSGPEFNWYNLARNRYGDVVAGAISPNILGDMDLRRPLQQLDYLDPVRIAHRERHGWVFIVPHLRDYGAFLLAMFAHVLPNLAPELFPHIEGARWVERPEYELPRVRGLKDEINRVEEAARQRVQVLEVEMAEIREAEGYLHDLLRQTDAPLVQAVKQALEACGFQSIVDTDAERERAGGKGDRIEDLQIWDDSPLLLVEVKGVLGPPKDNDVLQITKHIAPRMRQLQRTDIQGLVIINHDRGKPGLERSEPFREVLVTAAEAQHIGLMTTWDLFRLIRSYQQNGWTPEQIRPLFYQLGHIQPVPAHYQFVGVLEEWWEKAYAIGVRLTEGSLRVGDRISIEFAVEFNEQEINSLQLDDSSVAEAEKGMFVGIKTPLTKALGWRGASVFRVNS